MKYILIPIFLCFLVTAVTAASLDATTIPKTVAPGSDFTLNIKTNGVPDGRWAVTYEVNLKGGCTRSGKTKIEGFALNDVGEDKNEDYTIKAPSSEGTCTFEVVYTFTQESEKRTSTSASISTPAAREQPVQQQTQPEPIRQEPARPTPTPEGNTTNAGWIVVIAVVIIGIIIFAVMSIRKVY